MELTTRYRAALRALDALLADGYVIRRCDKDGNVRSDGDHLAVFRAHPAGERVTDAVAMTSNTYLVALARSAERAGVLDQEEA